MDGAELGEGMEIDRVVLPLASSEAAAAATAATGRARGCGDASSRAGRGGRDARNTRLAKFTFYGWRRRRESSGNIRVARYSHRKCLA